MRRAYESRPIVVHVEQRHREMGARERPRSAVGDGRRGRMNVLSKDKLRFSQGSFGIQVRKRGRVEQAFHAAAPANPLRYSSHAL
jgi:hypothetical protein